MKDSIFNTIFLFGGLQALLLIVGINIQKPFDSFKKITTSTLLLVILVASTYYVILISQWKAAYTYFWMLGSIAWMALLPSYYSFIRSVTDDSFLPIWKHYLIYGLSFFFLIEWVIESIFPGNNTYAFINDAILYLDIWMLLFFLNGAFFIIKIIRYLANSDHSLARLLLRFTLAIATVMIVYALAFVIIRQSYNTMFEISLMVLFQILVLAMVFRVFKLAPTKSFFAEPKYQNTMIKQDQDVQIFKSKIDSALVDQKLFLKPKLTLSELAHESGIIQNKLSEFFNGILKTSFYEYVNEARLNHVEELIHNNEHLNYTISALSLEGGFNSKTTFYKVFRERHNMTPSEYIKIINKKTKKS